MRQTRLRADLILIVAALVIAASFFIATLWVQYAFRVAAGNVTANDSGIYLLSPRDAYDLIVNGTLLYYDPDKFIDSAALAGSYADILSGTLPPVIVVYFILVIAGVFLVRYAYVEAERYRIDRMIDGLNSISEESFSTDPDPLLQKAYRRVEELVARNVKDYKRLHSYLTHEQKNSIAVLRADAEIMRDSDRYMSLERLADSIDDILTVSDTPGDSPLMDVDVSIVCARACDSYQTVADIRFDFDDEDCTILAKERWIYRAVCNLIDNAVKYGLGSPVEVTVRYAKRSVIVCVRDGGIGISDEEQGHIFDREYRIRELNKDGCGIGLSLVSHVCNLCGGFVFVESEKGKGSAFYLSFPGIRGRLQ
jgi:signal transduction histidine kinase